MIVLIKNEKRRGLFWFLMAGLITGVFAVILSATGNSRNLGICAALFLRDTAGALGLQSVSQYMRPEIPGFLLGAFLLSLFKGEWKSQGGSAPLARFAIAFFVMIGALVFLGCPLRMMLRLGGGDLNALVGLAGFAAGVILGTIFLRIGFDLGQQGKQRIVNGFVMPLIAVGLLACVILRLGFINFIVDGVESTRAPILFSLLLAFVIGMLLQHSGLSMSGSIRNIFLIRSFSMFSGYVIILAAALVGNLILGNFRLGFEGQPVAHSETIWNFLGMALTGYGSVLIGGCPLRQMIKSGEGNSDSGVCVLGFLLAGAVAHNFGLAASPLSGVPYNGKLAVIAGFVVITAIAVFSTSKVKRAG